MSRFDKELARLKSEPKDFTYEELRFLLYRLGFSESNRGHTSGSRVEFQDLFGRKILLHKPHPQDVMDIGTLRDLVNRLKELGEL